MKKGIVLALGGVVVAISIIGNVLLSAENKELHKQLEKYKVNLTGKNVVESFKGIDVAPLENTDKLELQNEKEIQTVAYDFLDALCYTDTSLDPEEYPSYDSLITPTGAANMSDYLGRPEKSDDPNLILEIYLQQADMYFQTRFENEHATVVIFYVTQTITTNGDNVRSGGIEPNVIMLEMKNKENTGWRVNSISYVSSMHSWGDAYNLLN